MNGLPPPVPGRECGECRACCQYLKIDAPDFHKAPNVLCEHWKEGCTIYETRPSPCRTFFCGWRLMPNLGDNWRPDRSNIFLRLANTNGVPGIDINLIGPLKESDRRELLSTIDNMIAAQFPAYLVIPGPAGHGAAKLLLNNRMRPAYESRAYANITAAFEEAIRAARSFETQPVGPSVP
ncbi:MAG TPA: hypothetical protein VIM56_02750 [Rhizomicrobium sp.]